MTTEKAHERAVELSKEFYDKNDAVGWFDALYAEAAGDTEKIPWADLETNPSFKAWLEKHKLNGANKKAVVVGCGLGDDAEELANYGFEITAFDISPQAIEWAKRIHPDPAVDYRVADLFALPVELKNKFDFVLEVYTIQALPLSAREKAIKAITELLAPNGELLVIERGLDEGETVENPPFPLWKSHLENFIKNGLTKIEFEDFFDNQEPPVRRFRVLYQRK
ncbi:MAG: class I SAM-dependent methyltransferase [Pyrinomonadaceae bacterium]